MTLPEASYMVHVGLSWMKILQECFDSIYSCIITSIFTGSLIICNFYYFLLDRIPQLVMLFLASKSNENLTRKKQVGTEPKENSFMVNGIEEI